MINQDEAIIFYRINGKLYLIFASTDGETHDCWEVADESGFDVIEKGFTATPIHEQIDESEFVITGFSIA